jgi:hypothetical protein
MAINAIWEWAGDPWQSLDKSVARCNSLLQFLSQPRDRPVREVGRLKFLLDNRGALDPDSPNPLLPIKARLLRISFRSAESPISVYAKSPRRLASVPSSVESPEPPENAS